MAVEVVVAVMEQAEALELQVQVMDLLQQPRPHLH
jgi:hypothetical protein